MSWEQRSADFCTAQTDAHMAYIEAEREADRLQTENEKLRKLCADLYEFAMDEYPEGTEISFAASMHKLGIEVSEK